MNFCSRHQHDLARQIKRKGMWHLVNTDPAVATRKAKAWLDGSLPRDEFDPLIASTFELYAKCRQMFGSSVVNGSGDHCALCVMNTALKDGTADARAIAGCTDLMLTICETHGISLQRQ